MGSKRKDPARIIRQVGAVPCRRESGALVVLLVTSRETRRWVVPKGNRMKGLSRAESAAAEALEEAGVSGIVSAEPFDSYLYWKRRDTYFTLCQVDLFRLDVTEAAETWKEKGERQRAWVPLEDAAELVVEPGLQAALRRMAEGEGDEGDGEAPALPV